jgi:Na+/phosphate symporter
LSFLSSKFIGNACFHVNNHDLLSTLGGLVFGIALGLLANKIAQALSKPTPKSEEEKSDHSA